VTTACTSRDCTKEAVTAIRTTHGGRDTYGIKTTVWSALEDAPKAASRYCAEHGAKLMSDMVLTMAGEYGR
jgi:hypothetical protein